MQELLDASRFTLCTSEVVEVSHAEEDKGAKLLIRLQDGQMVGVYGYPLGAYEGVALGASCDPCMREACAAGPFDAEARGGTAVNYR